MKKLFEAAARVIPGGVNSPVRAFGAVGGTPVFIERGEGPYMYGHDGRRYIDYIGSWGPMIHGHAQPEILRAVHDAIDNGLSFGAPTEIETRLAERIIELMPAIEQIRMVNSGTEATMSAIRLARGFTGRDKLIKFEGCYHGHADGLLVKAGSGAATIGVPTSPGIPEATARDTITLPFNDADALEAIFEVSGRDIAAVIVEAITGNMNMLLPLPGYLETMRALCDRYDTVLIFDEVMTGFRVGPGGAQELTGIKPDITCLGKIIGGGMPVGAYGGRRDIMQKIAPTGPVYQAGTLSGNPVAMAAGLATINRLTEPGFYDRLSARTTQLIDGLSDAAATAKIPFNAVCAGGMFGFVFANERPHNFDDVSAADLGLFKRFFHAMLERGVYLAPSAYEAGFVSAAHDGTVIDETIAHAVSAFAALNQD